LIVDVNGLLLAVLVLGADSRDVDGLSQMLRQKNPALANLKLLWLDSGYRPYYVHGEIFKEHGIRIQMVTVAEATTTSTTDPGFPVIPRRWVVERTFAWLSNFRLLSKEYELLTSSSEADIYIAMTSLMLRRLTPDD
jgi:putative transposase